MLDEHLEVVMVKNLNLPLQPWLSKCLGKRKNLIFFDVDVLRRAFPPNVLRKCRKKRRRNHRILNRIGGKN